MHIYRLLPGLALAGLAYAHPGHDIRQEAAERRAFFKSVQRSSLAHCADSLNARQIQADNVRRRSTRINEARQKRGLRRRDTDTVIATDHNKTSEGYSMNTNTTTLFAGYNSCLLTPEVTQGPYYVSGEYVRENIVETQDGIDTFLDFQIIDINTCEPVPDVYVEIWHCNATGVYSGIVASGNGNSADSANIDQTWLRGIQQSDDNGVAGFESIFPGHYTSRATHIHVMVHTNATLLANSTIGSTNYASHVGQTFFDQSLISAVELLAPYNTNTQELTTNVEDSILSEEADTDGVDPLMEYTLLGDSVADGIFAWIAFGINLTLSDSITPAASYYAAGGVENSDSSAGGGGSGSPP